MPENVDAVIIGSGQGGNPLATALAAHGHRTVVVESKFVGGTCVNYGCTPTKAMIADAQVAEKARQGARYGVHTGPVTVNMAEVRERKRAIVEVSRQGSEKRFEGKENLELVRGLGRFTGERTVEVALHGGGTRTFTAGKVFINTGLRTAVPAALGLETLPYLTNETVMELDEVPKKLLVLGGSYIAVEFAQMFRRFGAEVAIVSDAPQLLPREDPDIAGCLQDFFREDGIELVLGAKATAAGHTGDGSLTLGVEFKDGSDRTLFGSHLLLAAGRTPNTDALDLEATGLHVDEHGFIPVNDRLETAVPGTYALGDVKGGPAFTHISYDDYRILAANLLEGGSRSTKDRPVPYTVFTDPELGRIGMSVTEAKQSGRNIRVAKMPAKTIARAFETGDDRGVMKIVVDVDTEQILGASILAGEGGELAAMVEIAMMGKLPYTALRDAVFAHPVWAESLNSVFTKWED